LSPGQENHVRAALLLMDYQVGIVTRHGAEAAVAAAAEAAGRARAAGVPVYWVQVGFRPGYPEVSRRNRMFSALAEAGQLVLGDPATALHPALRPEPDEVVVTKKRVSAFAGSDLDAILRAAGIDTLVLGGVATSGVVLSTTRQAADLDYGLIVLGDACAEADAEVHRVLLEKVFPRQADVTTVGDWAASLS
jgi:nicotinamidase-related amidase